MKVRQECKECGTIITTDEPLSVHCMCGSKNWKHLENIYNQVPDLIQAQLELEECYRGIIDLMKRFVDVPEAYQKLIAIWIIGTYLHSHFETFPFLFFNAMRGSGKTRLLKFISALASKSDGSVQNNISEAVLFRTPQGTTLCIDEIENIASKEKNTLRELLNAAYKKGIKVKRMKKIKANNQEDYKVEEFEPYLPIAMANIWGLEEVLQDRSITLILEKSSNPGIIKKIDNVTSIVRFSEIKKKLTELGVVWCCVVTEKNIIGEWNDYIDRKYNDITTQTTQTAQDNTKQHQEHEELFRKIDDSGITGRHFELIFPLLITAELIHTDILNELINITKNIMLERKEEEYSSSKDVMVYDFVSHLDKYRYEWVPTKFLVNEFRQFTNEDGEWLNDKWLGRALKRLCLITEKRRLRQGREFKLAVDKAKEKIKIFKHEYEQHEKEVEKDETNQLDNNPERKE